MYSLQLGLVAMTVIIMMWLELICHIFQEEENMCKSQEVNKIIFVIVMCNIFAVGTELSDYHVTLPTSMMTCLPITPITWT